MSSQIQRNERITCALAALGFYFVLIAIQMLIVFVINARSLENDVFGGNLFLGTGFLAVGMSLLIVGIGFGRHTSLGHVVLLALLLAIGGAILFALYYWLFGNRYYAFKETISALPPYIGIQEFLLSVGLGIAVGVLGWLIATQRSA